jgi:hypothetical protein
VTYESCNFPVGTFTCSTVSCTLFLCLVTSWCYIPFPKSLTFSCDRLQYSIILSVSDFQIVYSKFILALLCVYCAVQYRILNWDLSWVEWCPCC